MAERVTRQQVEVVASGDGDVRATQQYAEILSTAAVIHTEDADNTLVITQSAAAQKIASPSAASSLSMSDSAAANTIDVAATSALALTQAAGWTGPLPPVSVNNTLALTVVTSKTFGSLGREASSALALTHETDQNIKFLEAVSTAEELNLDTSSRLADTWEASASSELALAQTALGQSLSPKAFSTLVLEQFADNKNKQRNVENTLVLNQAATGENIKTAQSTIVLTQVADRGAIELYATSALSLNTTTKANPINRSLSNTLALSQNVRQSIRNVSASTTMELSQSINVIRPFYPTASNALIGSELQIDPVTNLPVWIISDITQTATVVVNPTRLATTVLSFAQTAQPVLILAAAVAKSATSTLVLTQEAITGFAEDASNTLSLTQSASGVIGFTAVTEMTQPTPDDNTEVTAGLRDVAYYQIFKAQSAASSLSLRQTLLYELVVDTTECDYTPFVGSTTEPDSPEPPRTTLPAPFADRTTDRFRLVYPDFTVTDTPVAEIVLRAPLLGNRDGVQTQRINRETRGGSLIVFADPKWPQFIRLTLQFRALSRSQALDLLNFLDETLGHFIGLQDHEGRAWKGVVTNPDEAVVQDGRGCQYSASIEMEAEFVSMIGLDAENTITLLDASSMDFGPYGRTATSALAIQSNSDYSGIIPESLSSPLALTQVAAPSGTLGKGAADSLSLTDATDRLAILGKPLASALGITDQADALHIITLSATSATAITDASVPMNTKDRATSNPLVLTDTPGKSRIRSMSNRASDAIINASVVASAARVWSRAGTSPITFSDEALGAIELPEFSGALLHRWDATEISLGDGADILSVTDTGSALIDLQARGGTSLQAPTYKTNILNGQPVMRFVQETVGQALEGVSNITLFPSKRGTVALVVVPQESLAGIAGRFYLFDHRVGTNIEQLHFGGENNVDRPFPWSATTPDSTDGLETPPPDYAPETEGQILVVSRDSDTNIRFRRNGVEETGRTIASDPVPTIGTFTMGGNGQAAQSIDVDIALCVVYDKALSTAEMLELEAYLKVVYGVR